MSTVFFLGLPAHGHINPSLPLVAELVKQGERIIYYATPEFQARIAATGAEFRAYPWDDRLSPNAPDFGMFGLMANSAQITAETFPWLLAQAETERPAYLFLDSMCLWGNLLQQRLKIPAITSCTTFALHPKSGQKPPLDMVLLMLRTFPLLLRYLRQTRQLDKQYGTRSPSLVEFFNNRQALNLVFTSREFQPGAEHFGADYCFVGPALGARAEDATFPWAKLADRPILYVSLGTLFNDAAPFFKDCVTALTAFTAAQPGHWAVVLSLGKKVDPASLGKLPDHFVAQAYVPQLAVLERTALFITHGGMNSVSEALWYNVPTIVVPQMGDQYFVAQRITELKAGLSLPMAKVNPATLQAAAIQITQDITYKQQAAQLGASLRAAGGAQRAAAEVLAFKKRQGLQN